MEKINIRDYHKQKGLKIADKYRNNLLKLQDVVSSIADYVNMVHITKSIAPYDDNPVVKFRRAAKISNTQTDKDVFISACLGYMKLAPKQFSETNAYKILNQITC